MSIPHPNPPPLNLTGALIFTSYIFVALFLSAFIGWNLWSAYRAFTPSYLFSIHTRLRTCIYLSLLSFGVLSWHMLAFLIASYKEWAEATVVEGGWRGIGEWLTTATLFEDFARGLCGSWARYWWTAEALVLTFGVGRWMGREGRRLQVPHLWAYFALGQILPISFVQNLFAIAVLLSPSPSTSSHPDAKSTPSTTSSNESKSEAPPFIRNNSAPDAIPRALFYALLFIIPLSVDTPVFIPVILAVRLLLFVPLLLPSARAPSYRPAVVFIVPMLASSIAFIVENGLGNLLRRMKADPRWGYEVSAAVIKTVASAVNDNHAVQALGWDAVISMASGLVWYLAA